MLTVRNLDEALKAQLRISAAKHGCSMEEEVRRILRDALLPQVEQKGLGLACIGV
jgi:plasmid stability protein